MSDDQNTQKFWSKDNPLMWGVLISTAFLITILILAFMPFCETDNGIQTCQNKFRKFVNSSPNEIGDTLAGLAGALAFLWIIVTVLLQAQELKAQRNELMHTRLEFKEMNSLASRQSFDNLFFSILKTYNDIIASVDLTGKKKNVTYTGRDCFGIFFKRVKNKYDGLKPTTDLSEKDLVGLTYQKFYLNHESELGHYFRFLYRSFLIISEHSEGRDKHAKMLRSQLSDNELLLLFYNILGPHGQNFKTLAVKYQLFDNLPLHRLLDPSHVDLLPLASFGENVGLIHLGRKS